MPPTPSRGVRLPAVALIMLLTLLAGAVAVSLIRVEPRPRHLVLLVLDTVRADHLSCYGYGRPTTPNLDAFAAQGLLFEQARTVAPWTLPAHASLFTGLLPDFHGCHWEHRYLVDSRVTLADWLSAEYETFGITSNVNASSYYHLDQGFRTFLETWQLRGRHPGLDDGAIVLREIEEWLDDRDRSQPFFLFANFMDAHLPYDPPPPYDRQFGDVPEPIRELARSPDLLRRVLVGDVVVTDEVRQGLTDLYDAELRRLDERVGAFLDMLEVRGLAENTMVVITSDHGEHLGEDGLVDHQLSMREELLHVPLLVRLPSRVTPARISERVSLVQVFRWLLDASEDQVPEWTPPPERRPPAYLARYFRPIDLLEFLSESGRDATPHDRRVTAAYPSGSTLKLVEDSLGHSALYDLAGAGEGVDCQASHAETMDRLHKVVARFLQNVRAEETEADLLVETDDGPADARQELESLGYVEARRQTSLHVHALEHWQAGVRARGAGDLETARVELHKALTLAPDHADVLLEVAEVEDLLDHDPLDYYRRFLAQVRGTPRAETERAIQARRRVQRLQGAGAAEGGNR